MRKHPSSLLIALLLAATTLNTSAQRRRTNRAPALPVAEQVNAALVAYDFTRAEELLTKEIATLKRRRQPTEQLEQQLHTAQQGIIKLRATECIAIIDSVICNKEEALRAIRLSAESGRIDTYASTYHTADALGATIYENELANKRYLAVPSADGTGLRLAYSDKLGTEWATPTPLTGLNTDDLNQNYPFLLADGVTLYYAATGPESLGGYDIFITRADGEDGSFLAPENIGFPYNSLANDYLLAIDELNQLGWFVTDRLQPQGKVCVYTFIPNDTRQLYPDDTEQTTLRDRARITAIRDTWDGNTQEAIKRLQELRSGKTDAAHTKPDFVFPIDDKQTYTSIDDFKSATARKNMQTWLQLNETTDTDATMLERLREKYATAKADERQAVAAAIRRIEASHYLHIEELKQLAKDIRNAEITSK
ncbi:MAG: hypothetical protein IJS59_09980 [Bacteroidaceae bacterium]|nr:hypothetical protein [Bacteroidaceae bacterium]